MQTIDNVSDNADQLIQAVLEDGSVVQMELTYLPASERWALSFSHPTVTVDGMNLTAHPNIARQYRNIAPFGIACTTVDGADPAYIEDFVNGRATLYVLTAADVQNVEVNIFGQYPGA